MNKLKYFEDTKFETVVIKYLLFPKVLEQENIDAYSLDSHVLHEKKRAH